jgi:thiosulfate/3-mercaptopyruvate sulfurtransferase
MCKRLLISFLVISLISSAVAQQRTKTTGKPKMNSEMVVSTKWVSENLQNPNVVILHVGRDRATYDAGHIPAARFLALGDIVVNSMDGDNELPPVAQLERTFGSLGIGNKTRVVLYGDQLGLFAARAYFTLDYLGGGNRAALLDGGLEKWKRENRPLSKDAVRVMPTNFTAKPNPKVLADFAKVREVSQSLARPAYAETTLIDSRPDADFTSGHIPGAVSVFWHKNFESADDPSLKPPFELRNLYEGFGVTRDKPVIAYCRSGVQASYTYFILKWLGYDVAMYDGSYQQWSRTASTH